MDYVKGKAEVLGLLEFEAANRSLAMHLFKGEALTEGNQKMLEFILSSGTYGTIENRIHNKMEKNHWGKLRYMLYRFSVPISRKNRDYEAFARHYSLFYRHKILLPLLPFYRVYLSLKSGRFGNEARAIRNAKASFNASSRE